MQLNEEQTLAVEHPLNEPACLIAGAGSGKTRVLTERVRHLMDKKGVVPKRICAVTFTNKAAGELLTRLGLDTNDTPLLNPRVSTIHSLALGAIRKNPPAFSVEGECELKDRVSPLDDYDQSQMMKKIIERGKITDTNPWRVLENISFHRARGVGFMSDYTEEIAAEAEVMHGGYHAMGETELCLWKLYEEEKARNSVVDFDDMLHLTVRRFRRDAKWRGAIQAMWDHVLMDEAQDTNPVQWEFVNSLLAPSNMNIYVVGDMSQCQPPGSVVKIKVSGHKPNGYGKPWTPSEWVEKDISTLVDGELAESWTRKDQRTYKIGRKIKVASRPYKGILLKVCTGDGKQTRVTPNHQLWVRLGSETSGKYIVYLMWRENFGFRVGMAKLKRNNHAFGLTARMRQEKADKGWVLAVKDSKREARKLEEIVSCYYGIPQTCFEADLERLDIFQSLQTATVEASSPTSGSLTAVLPFEDRRREGKGGSGWACLKAFRLLWECPSMVRWSENQRQYNHNWRGYFKTAAANVQILVRAGLQVYVPIEGNNQSTPILVMPQMPYEGLVYSLDVEKDHTYVVDGIVVGNSIYGFNGAVPQILKDFSENWRGVQPKLYRIARNHRSGQKIVDMANAIQNKMTRTIPLKMESWRGLNGEKGKIEIIRGTMSRDIASEIAIEIYKDNEKFLRDAASVANGVKPRESAARPISYRENCILVRAAIQIRDIEAELVRRKIPYVVRGGRGLLQTEEVRDVLSYMRLATNHRDFMAFVRAASVPRRGCGEVALEKIRAIANDKHDGDLIAAAEGDKNAKIASFGGIVRLISQFGEDPVAMLERTLALTQYTTYLAEKYKRDSNKVKTKLENLDRFAQLLEGMVADNKMTAEDIIFQLTLDRPKDDDESGAVTISTIHSAKGLEWKRVYVANVVESSLPHKFSMGSEDEIEEERRLFYVACTRARDYLNLCVPAMYQQPDSPNVIMLKPSRFLAEISVH